MQSAMKKERVTKDEIDQFVRNSDHGSYETVTAVILETDGSLSVVT